MLAAAVSSLMSAAVMPFLMMGSVMAAYRIRVIIQSPSKKLFYLLVRIAGAPRIQVDSCLRQRRARTAANTAADQHIDPAAKQKARKSAVPLSVSVYNLSIHNLLIFYMVYLEFLRMPKMLEHLSVLISHCNLHLNLDRKRVV